MQIDSFADAEDWSSGRRRTYEQKDPPPEKYSLEWYVLEGEKNRLARERAREPVDQRGAGIVVAAALLVSTVGLIAVRGA